MPDGVTTAEVLARYRDELLDRGMPAHLVDDLVRDAAHQLVDQSGLGVTDLSSVGDLAAARPITIDGKVLAYMTGEQIEAAIRTVAKHGRKTPASDDACDSTCNLEAQRDLLEQQIERLERAQRFATRPSPGAGSDATTDGAR